MNYRAKLYANYSGSFGGLKAYRPELQWRQYEGCYPALPPDKGAAIADAGSGQGEWLAWLASRGYDNLTGFELSAPDLDIARRHAEIRFVQADATSALRDSGPVFQLIHAKDVLEHFSRDEAVAFLEAAREALAPGGQLWVLTFNAQAPFASATRYGDFTHELGFTPASLLQVLNAVGLRTVSVQGVHLVPPTLPGQVRRLAWAAATPLWRFFLRARHGGSAGGVMDRFSCAPDLFAVAEKPLPASGAAA